ncbi:unnamed protein product [Closterium sp. Naga37s-1]|nr:unnamed protein product [Closterium sp. Naga37s-1]
MALSSLRRLRQSLSEQLNPLGGRAFRVFYKFAFFLSREQGQKGVDVATAVEAWRFALAGVFPLVDSWCDFVPLHQRYAVSEDTWQQVLDFSCTIGADLSMYDSDGAWPVLIDEFVECYSRSGEIALDRQSARCLHAPPSVLLLSLSSHAFRQHTMGSNSSLSTPPVHLTNSHGMPSSLLLPSPLLATPPPPPLPPHLSPSPLLHISSFNEARWLTTNGSATTATPAPTTLAFNPTPAVSLPHPFPPPLSSISLLLPPQQLFQRGPVVNHQWRPGPISPTGVDAFQTPTYRHGPFSPTSVEPFQSPTHRAGRFSPSRGRAEEAGGAGRVGAARRALGAEVGSGVGGGLGAVFGAAGRGVIGACEVGGVGVLGRGGGRGGGGSERVKRCWRDVREETEQRERIESISLKMAGLSPPNGDCKRQRVTQW